MKRFLAFTLSLVMLLTLCPTVLAEEVATATDPEETTLTAPVLAGGESPVVSIVPVGPIELVEGCDGWYEWNETQGKCVFIYDFEYRPEQRYTVTFTHEYAQKLGLSSERVNLNRGELQELTGYELQWNYDRYTTWTAGNTYQATVSLMGRESAPVDITIVPSPVVSIVPVGAVELTENCDGNWDWDENGSYYRYDPGYWWNARFYTVTLTAEGAAQYTDGVTTLTAADEELWELFGYLPEWNSDQSYENRWTAGNIYQATVIFMGKESAPMNVTIVPSPVVSIAPIGPIELRENYDGWYDWNYVMNRDTFIYDPDTRPEQRYTVTFTHEYAQKLGLSSERVNLNRGELQELTGYDVQWLYDQNTPWTAGNTYQAAVSFMGRESAEVEITIVPSPVVSIVPVGPIELIENWDGWYDENEEPGREVFIYNPDNGNKQRYIVTFTHEYAQKLGLASDTLEGDWGDLLDLTGECTEWPYDRSGTKKAGDTYQASVRFMGRESEAVEITIVPSPVVSIVPVGAIELIENRDGYSEWNEELGRNVFVYDPDYGRERCYTVTFTHEYAQELGLSSDVFTGDAEELGRLTGNYTQWRCDQSTPWTAGNTYPASVRFMGAESETVTVGIIKTPVVSIRVNVKRVDLIENCDGDWDEDEGGSYYRYDPGWVDGDFVYTVTLTQKGAEIFNGGKKNTTFSGSNRELYEKFGCWPEWVSQQSSAAPWTVNNTYEATLTFMGVSGDAVPVTVVPSPVVSIVPEGPIELIEYYDGWYGWNEVMEEETFVYNPDSRPEQGYTVTFTPEYAQKLGLSSERVNLSGWELQELTGYETQWLYDQNTPWTVGNTYQASVSFIGRESEEVDITVVPSPVVSISVDKEAVELVEGTSGWWDEMRGCYVYNPGYYNETFTYTVTFTREWADAHNGGETVFEGVWRDLEELVGMPQWSTAQDDGVQWVAGGIYDATVSLLGVAGNTVSVTIVSGTPLTLDKTTVPDPVLRQYLLAVYDLRGDGVISAEAVREIWCPGENVRNAECVKLFPELRWVNLSFTGITSLDVSKNPKLITLEVTGTKLTSLDVSGNPALEVLYCNGCGLNTLRLPGAEAPLKNFVPRLMAGGPADAALEVLDCSGNALTELDLSTCPAMKELNCSNNDLTELDLSENENLTEINCSDNAKLTELNVAAVENVVLTTAGCSDDMTLKEKGEEVTEKLAGTVDLHNPMLEYATVELLDGSGEVVGTSRVAGGNYTVWGVSEAVTVRFSAEGCVSHSCAYAAALNAALVNAGDITGARGKEADVTDPQDMQALYEHLSGANVLTDEYALTVADVNGDSVINILDYQALYEAIKVE